MNPWPIGHKLIYVAGLPVASTPFGAHARPEAFGDWADFLLTGDEAAAVASLQRRRLRWVVVDGDLPPIGSAIVARGENPRDYYGTRLDLAGGVEIEPRPPLLRSLYFRLTRWIGSAATLAGGSEREEEIPALEHFRLLLDSADDASRGSIKAFELVPGAELGISGPPGAPLALEYAFTSDTGRDRVYRRTVTLDAGGRAQVRVPYSSARPDLGQVSAWRLTGLGIDQRIPVSERAVRRGERIAVTAAPAGVGDRAGENGHRAGENGHRAGENGDGAGENGHRAGDVAG